MAGSDDDSHQKRIPWFKHNGSNCGFLNLIYDKYSQYHNLILYCMIGCVGASLDFFIFSALVTWFDLHHQIANVISISIGIIVNFFLNYKFNFKSRGKLLLRLLSFYLVGLFGLGLSTVLLWLFVDCLKISITVAKLGTIFWVVVVQYSLNKMISFRKNQND